MDAAFRFQNFIFKIPAFIILVIVISFFSEDVSGQKTYYEYQFDSTSVYHIELTDGSQFTGEVIYSDSDVVVLRTPAISEIRVLKKNIRRIDARKKSDNSMSNYWFKNPNSHRYLLSPSAITLKKKEGYYQNTMLFLNSFSVGITDNVSVGGGVELLTTLFRLADPLFFFNFKAGFQAGKNIYVGGGALIASIPEWNDTRGQTGSAYFLGTYGNHDHNFTLGSYFIFVEDNPFEIPIISISGMSRAGKRVAVIIENWILPYIRTEHYYMLGLRILGEKISVDLALLNSQNFRSGIIGWPFVEVIVNF